MSGTEQITISQYILDRLKQLQVKSIFGVPGDFNLEFLDYIEKSNDHLWVGNANELNAAYAADGYARVKRNSLGCLVTTFGVGELSALCGVAGMMSERLPLLHIVGIPSTSLQHKHALLHHTLGDGSFSVFSSMSKHIVADMAILTNSNSAAAEIDRILITAITQCRPVYLGLPTDLVHATISNDQLSVPLKQSAAFTQHQHASQEALEHVAQSICARIKNAENPVFLIDACASRFSVQNEILALVEYTNLPFFTTPMAKAILSESHPQFGGCYMGENSIPAIAESVHSADLVITIGGILSDFNTGSFSYKIKTQNTIELHSDHVKLGFALFPGMSMKVLLPMLHKRLAGMDPLTQTAKTLSLQQSIRDGREQAKSAVTDDPKWGADKINQSWFWPTISKFFKPRDIIITETGTSSFGVLDIEYPENALAVSQVLWGSIGYTCPAALGCALAAREQQQESESQARRTLLFIGDGSLQLTLQEIGTMARRNVNPFIFVLNNDGYEIERQIHGEKAEYNNIQPYDHSKILELFASSSSSSENHAFYRAETRAELEALLFENSEFTTTDKLRIIEVLMPRGDAPRALITQAKLTANANNGTSV